jgi:hypothetical protein
VIDRRTGILLPADPSSKAIADAVSWLSASRALSMRAACESRAADFSQAHFLAAFQQLLH